MNIADLNTQLFSISHLSDADLKDIKKFKITNPQGKGLELYLKNQALLEEQYGDTRTYLIRDNYSRQIVAYFSLRTGLITQQARWFWFHTRTGIELANFAVNDNYREANDVIPQLGKYVFSEFVYPLVSNISQFVGASYLYIFALPEDRLMKHYEKMGFSRLERRLERFLHRHVRPKYDTGCIFMFQKIISNNQNDS